MSVIFGSISNGADATLMSIETVIVLLVVLALLALLGALWRLLVAGALVLVFLVLFFRYVWPWAEHALGRIFQ